MDWIIAEESDENKKCVNFKCMYIILSLPKFLLDSFVWIYAACKSIKFSDKYFLFCIILNEL